MSSIRNESAALDTNEFIFALRKDEAHPASEALVFDKLSILRIYLPLPIFLELQRNLTGDELRSALRALSKAKALSWDHALVPPEAVEQWQRRGAKKGDAVIAAHLELKGIQYFVSENRHFLTELKGLPFTVLTAQEALDQLA